MISGECSKGDESKINKQWQAAQLFVAKGPSSALEFLVDDVRNRLFALRAQGLDGKCTPEYGGTTITADPSLKRKREAWKSLGNMPKTEAKRMYVELLTEVAPEWTAWDSVHGEALRAAQREGSEADRLLRAFSKRTGVQIRSRL